MSYTTFEKPQRVVVALEPDKDTRRFSPERIKSGDT